MLTSPVPVPSSIMPGSIESTAFRVARLMAGRWPMATMSRLTPMVRAAKTENRPV